MLATLKGVEDQAQGLLAKVPEELPILPLRNTVALPFAMIPLAVGIPRSVRLVEEALAGNRLIGLMAMREPEVEEPLPGQIFEVGTVAYIHRVIRSDDGDLQVIVQGLERIKIEVWTATSPYLRAKVALAPDIIEPESVETEALRRTLLQVARDVINLMPNLPKEVALFLEQLDNPRHLTYMIASNIRIEMADSQKLLEIDHLNAKVRMLITHLTREKELLSLGQKITEDAQEEMTKQQREYFLRQQQEAIRR